VLRDVVGDLIAEGWTKSPLEPRAREAHGQRRRGGVGHELEAGPRVGAALKLLRPATASSTRSTSARSTLLEVFEDEQAAVQSFA